MTNQPATTSSAATRTTVSSRVSGYVSSRRGGMFGIAEIIAVAVSCLILVLVIFSYLYFMIPARSRVASLTADRAQLQTNLKKSEDILKRDQSTQETVRRITESLYNFENVSLQREDVGRMELYSQLNQLMVKNGLRNTSGPTYAPLEIAGTKATPGKSTSTKWQTAYPGIAVAVTVEGPYQNLRQFIKDIERSKQFVIINEVELQRATQSDAAATAGVPPEGGEGAGTGTGTGTRTSLVSLQLSMATYFQRPGAVTPTSQEQ